MQPKPGQVVVSIAGRDAGRRYVVTQVIGRSFVALADGAYRPVSRPKRKNVRHLMLTSETDARISSKILAGAGVTDEEVREALTQSEDDWCRRASWAHE